jgi:hypothetical protein
MILIYISVCNVCFIINNTCYNRGIIFYECRKNHYSTNLIYLFFVFLKLYRETDCKCRRAARSLRATFCTSLVELLRVKQEKKWIYFLKTSVYSSQLVLLLLCTFVILSRCVCVRPTTCSVATLRKTLTVARNSSKISRFFASLTVTLMEFCKRCPQWKYRKNSHEFWVECGGLPAPLGLCQPKQKAFSSETYHCQCWWCGKVDQWVFLPWPQYRYTNIITYVWHPKYFFCKSFLR